MVAWARAAPDIQTPRRKSRANPERRQNYLKIFMKACLDLEG